MEARHECSLHTATQGGTTRCLDFAFTALEGATTLGPTTEQESIGRMRISNHVDDFGDPNRKATARVLRKIADRLDTHRDISGEVLQMLVDDLAELGYSPSDKDAA